jgi:hypothetical protein
MMKYDKHTCITAAELRAMGMPVDESVPDCAWVLRSAMRFGQVEVGEQVWPHDPTVVHGSFTVSFTEPFRWVEVDVPVENEQQLAEVMKVLREENSDA